MKKGSSTESQGKTDASLFCFVTEERSIVAASLAQLIVVMQSTPHDVKLRFTTCVFFTPKLL